LKRRRDFEDMEAEERALDHVMARPGLPEPLALLVRWPTLDLAAALVLDRADLMDGDHYEILTPAAEALADKNPLAATVLLRAMIDFSLEQARSKRYSHVARHLPDCARLAERSEDWGDTEPQDAYVARLKTGHGRKSSFRSLVE
jgi:hypothetical protein